MLSCRAFGWQERLKCGRHCRPFTPVEFLYVAYEDLLRLKYLVLTAWGLLAPARPIRRLTSARLDEPPEVAEDGGMGFTAPGSGGWAGGPPLMVAAVNRCDVFGSSGRLTSKSIASADFRCPCVMS